jgi:hypothetical protein
MLSCPNKKIVFPFKAGDIIQSIWVGPDGYGLMMWKETSEFMLSISPHHVSTLNEKYIIVDFIIVDSNRPINNDLYKITVICLDDLSRYKFHIWDTDIKKCFEFVM